MKVKTLVAAIALVATASVQAAWWDNDNSNTRGYGNYYGDGSGYGTGYGDY